MSAAGRKILYLGALCATALLLVVDGVLTVNSIPTRHLSGWLVLLAIIMLLTLSVYKRISFLPLGTASGWLIGHLLIGLALWVPLALHVDLATVSGAMELALVGLVGAAMASGIVGWWLSWQLPRRLTSRGEAIIFERIAARRLALAEDVEQLVSEPAEDGQPSALLTALYQQRLAAFFVRHKHFWHHVRQSERPRQALLSELDNLYRYASPSEQKTLAALTRRVIDKYNLDYQYALQSTLKGWLFLHVPVSYGLLAFSLGHAAAIYWYPAVFFQVT